MQVDASDLVALWFAALPRECTELKYAFIIHDAPRIRSKALNVAHRVCGVLDVNEVNQRPVSIALAGGLERTVTEQCDDTENCRV